MKDVFPDSTLTVAMLYFNTFKTQRMKKAIRLVLRYSASSPGSFGARRTKLALPLQQQQQGAQQLLLSGSLASKESDWFTLNCFSH